MAHWHGGKRFQSIAWIYEKNKSTKKTTEKCKKDGLATAAAPLDLSTNLECFLSISQPANGAKYIKMQYECNMLQYVAVQCYGLFHPHLSLGRLWHYSPLLQKIVAHCDAFRLDHTSQSQNVSNLHWSHVRTSCMKWNCFYIYHENQWNSMSNLNNYECFIFCSTSIDVLFDFLLCWSWPKAPLWRIQRVPSGPRFPMYLARLPGGEHKKGPTTSNTKQNFRTKQIGNKCAWSAGKVLRVVVCKRLSYHVISVINKFAFLGKSSRVDLLMCVSGRGAVVA